jgi:hypothetical protein
VNILFAIYWIFFALIGSYLWTKKSQCFEDIEYKKGGGE